MYTNMPAFLVYVALSFVGYQLVSAQNVSALEVAQVYAPKKVPCPVGIDLIASYNGNLSSFEETYVSRRRENVLPGAFKEYLQCLQNTKYTLPAYVTDVFNGLNGTRPTMAIAGSGGGYRAVLFEAGVLNALDARNETSCLTGLGGVLQVATYWAALSGGGELAAAAIQADLPLMRELIFGSTAINNRTFSNTWGGMNINLDYFAPSSNITITEEYLGSILEELAEKYTEYPVTFADLWARIQAYHFVNGTNTWNFFQPGYHGVNILFSELYNVPVVENATAPYLILVSDTKSPQQGYSTSGIYMPGENFIPLGNVHMELTIDAFGTHDPRIDAYIPMQFLGSTGSTCVQGFDNVGYIIGCTSAIFNEANYSTSSLSTSSVYTLFELLEQAYPQAAVEYDAAMIPNTFQNFQPETNPYSNDPYLYLVDGGEDGINLPLDSVTRPERGVDSIIAIDASGTVNSFAVGLTLVTFQERQILYPDLQSTIPPVPNDTSIFTMLNLSTQPSFFGCNLSLTEPQVPLLIYLANGGPPPGMPPITNISTTNTSINLDAIDPILDQVNQITTQGRYSSVSTTNYTDPTWPACLACAIADRKRLSLGIPRSGICADCMNRYCVYENYLASLSK